MNVALGFDTYVVMRHGVKENKLGCYFCNDVVAPRDVRSQLQHKCKTNHRSLLLIVLSTNSVR